MAEGFQIPDFKGDTAFRSLREAIEARERHIEMHDLMQSILDHADIPATFDGEIPEFAFGNASNRLLIGRRYQVEDGNGVERIGVLTSACVVENEQNACCGLLLDNGSSALYKWPLSAEEMNAWRKHPDTFFGEVGQRTTKVESPIEMYDFFHACYRETPREKLLEFMANAPDMAELQTFDQPTLSSIYAERLVYSAMVNQKPSADAE